MTEANSRDRVTSLYLFNAVVLFIALALVFSGILHSQQPAKSYAWDGWQFLLGEWVGEGGGEPGQGTGGFTFLPDLQNTILVRKNFADYPSQKDKLAYRHDDLMVIYRGSDGSNRAIYFDNEGHVINYDVSISADSSSVVFESGIIPSEPRYRLTYSKMLDESIGIRFEIAPPGKPDAFTKYTDAKAHRKK